MTDAAGQLHLSRRTATRRLTEARARLGTTSTADAAAATSTVVTVTAALASTAATACHPRRRT